MRRSGPNASSSVESEVSPAKDKGNLLGSCETKVSALRSAVTEECQSRQTIWTKVLRESVTEGSNPLNSRNEEYLYHSDSLMKPGHVLQSGWSMTSALREFTPEMAATMIGPRGLEMDPPFHHLFGT